MNARQRRNLLKLADYLESLPKNYKHFAMYDFVDHDGECDLPMEASIYAVKEPAAFLANCGTVACAAGHGPAAGIPVRDDEIRTTYGLWSKYVDRVFGSDNDLFGFLFDSPWEHIDNHHYGAAARIRYFLDTGEKPGISRATVRKYAPYRKGSKARCVRDRSGAAVETAKTGSTVGKSPAPAGGDAQP